MDEGSQDTCRKKAERMFKTREQVEALEKFYNEHKYPNESLKLDLANQIGLSERQVSVWFCHRRSKDKRILHSDNQLSETHSTNIEDLESKGSYCQNQKQNQNRSTTIEDRSTDNSGSDSDNYLNFLGGMKNETAAISLVKRKLGMMYCEDGPMIGVRFDPLPPGAFDSPLVDSSLEPYFDGDLAQVNHPRSFGKLKVYNCTSEIPSSTGTYHSPSQSNLPFFDRTCLPDRKNLNKKVDNFALKASLYSAWTNRDFNARLSHPFNTSNQDYNSNLAYQRVKNMLNPVGESTFIDANYSKPKDRLAKKKKVSREGSNEPIMVKATERKFGSNMSNNVVASQAYSIKGSQKNLYRKPKDMVRKYQIA